ncbi:alpha/beta fold hydrolase [Paracraurococcus ruber]|uniref:Epoxide hydrolase n=1 Tax=Paracraurococcus ruber TaxID=77675 RepID=A0ABS1D277_9PROT|nr:alpha/beta hydrolase [Paracraurococcus ruber]MBK1660019.1 epoxide hydrolase [Paracraurococcus ruber]TDG28658.1 alpha/beta hydrolase [Paracraurococcus ruber]
MDLELREGVVRTARHATFYLECGPPDGPLLVFLHGWPELSISWRHQLPCFAALGFRCVAPDMRGYGRSSVHPAPADHALEPITQDMLELLAGLGRDRAVWVGHDWGSPVVWSLAAHHAARCVAVASLCVPYLPDGFALPHLIALVDRRTYPEADYPAGQWDYQLFYEENAERARAVFDADVDATIRALFRRGNPAARGKPGRTASIRRDGGWFGGADRAPDVPLDTAVLSPADHSRYVAALRRTGFGGPDSWYLNHAANAAYAARAPEGGRLSMPVLFLHGAHDTTCETMDSALATPMRAACADLTEVVVQSGHWMAQEQPAAVNAALARWLAQRVPGAWPG